jgi:CRISPR/Cas system CSM-associated protein Csm3 (group 7 of RAMP superfamily)
MDMKSWCEYVRDVMDYFHLSNAYVAEKAEASEKTIERIRSVRIDQDIMRGTARRIELVVFGSAGNLTCHLDHDPTAAAELIGQLRAEVVYWRKENDRKAKIIDKYLDS